MVKLKEKIDSEETAPLIDKVYFGCAQRVSLTKESNVKTKSDLFATITTADIVARIGRLDSPWTVNA